MSKKSPEVSIKAIEAAYKAEALAPRYNTPEDHFKAVKSGAKVNRCIIPTLEEFKERGGRFPTDAAIHHKLGVLANYLAKEDCTDLAPDLRLWFVNAYNEFIASGGRMEAFAKALGQNEMGADRLYDGFSLGKAVEAAVKAGNTVRQSCEAVAKQYGCSWQNAYYHYYRRKNGRNPKTYKPESKKKS